MTTDRDRIFSAIKSALEPLPNRTPYPEWDDESVVCKAHPEFSDVVQLFAHKLSEASGKFCDSVESVIEVITANGASFGYCDPQLAHLFADRKDISFDTEYDMSKVDEYAFGITRAGAGIAESGTIMLKDADTSARLGALAPWVHVAVIDKDDIVPSLREAIQRFGNDPSVIFCTGPSKTADVEGILIQGVHGPGVQAALVLD